MAISDPFHGKIGTTWRDSTPWWPPRPKAPANAPNLVFIVLDDVGFSDIGCYGSEIATPRIDALAASGLRYTNFHVTAMCSPTRAALLTGRNAHAAGMGVIAEWAGGYPGYRGKLSKAAATIPETLAAHDYASYAVGKWHLMNLEEYGSAGPHDSWPLGRGFSRWYGFHGALADQWNPELFQDNRPIHLDKRDGYHLSTDLVDHSIGDIRDHLASAPDRPFFQYLAFGACHWPHQVPRDFIDRYRGRYSEGWDVVRQQRFEKQIALGIVPPGTRLAPRNPGVSPWDQLDPDVRRVSERLQETYAAFMDHTDAEIGRLVDFLAETNQLDNTLLVLLSDNGASPEGGVAGAINARRNLVYEKELTADAMRRLEEIGGERAFNHYATGWAQVSNTPLKWYKRGNHGGGIRAPLIVHWPRGIGGGGEIRTQYHHVTDIAPTVYEVLGVSAPESHNGIEQIPLHGVSMAYTFTEPQAPTQKTTQTFEMLGDRAVWNQGWKAVVRHPKGQDFGEDCWELYDLDADFSECSDLAASEPERLARLQGLWASEAQKYQIFPLDDRETERLADAPRSASRQRYQYQLTAGMARLDRHASPDIGDRGYRISADFRPAEGGTTEGVILSYGSWFGGMVLYVKDGCLNFEYRFSETVTHALSQRLPGGDEHHASVAFERTGRFKGVVRLTINGQECNTMEIARTWPVNVLTSGMNCGRDGTARVSDAYVSPFAFTGRNLRVLFTVDDTKNHGREGALNAAFKEQ